MNITQITPGLIRIPPNGWGAIEKVIWAYKLELENLNNICEIKYLSEVANPDIVHIHVANLALEAKEKGIPYIFSLHDHHVFRHGKNSHVYKENLQAIKGSIISFTHAEFLIDYFDETDKLFYLSHGVDTSYFKPNKLYRENHKLLCIANNGYADDQTIDRKGFRFAIEAAISLNLPITIAGPENNKNFFNANSDLLNYEKLNVIYKNLTDDEILELYQEHSIFLHPSQLEAGHPNLTLLEAIGCGLPIVGAYNGTRKLNGMVKTLNNTKNVIDGVKEVINNYKFYVDETQKTKLGFDWSVIVNRLNKIYTDVLKINNDYSTEKTKKLYINTFNNTELNMVNSNDYESVQVNCSFFSQPTVEIKGNSKKKFIAEFIDENNKVIYETGLKCNMWARIGHEYSKDVTIKVYEKNNLIHSEKLDYRNKRVYIHLDSSSLGDTLAWFPQIDEFRKKHNAEVVCSTFHNYLFKNKYPNLEFVEPGTMVHNLYKMIKIGWFYKEDDEINYNMHPNDFRDQHLQKTASDILGLDFKEVKPIIDFSPKDRPIKKKYFTIAIHSTAQAKYWNNPKGWQEVVDYLKKNGYEVVLLSKEEDGYMGNKQPKGVIKLNNKTLKEIMNYIHHSEGFVGISSGLSWLAWAVNAKIVLISGFSRPNLEMSDCERVFVQDTQNICNGCSNEYRLDAGDWNWCPKNKNTPKMFECSKNITSNQVIEKINKIINV